MDVLIPIVQSLYSTIGLAESANLGDVWGILTTLFVLIASTPYLISQKPTETPPPSAPPAAPVAVAKKDAEKLVDKKPEVVSVSWAERLKKGLGRSRNEVWNQVTQLFTSQSLNDDLIDEVEALLYGADLGPKTVEIILEELKEQAKKETLTEESFKKFLFEFLNEKLAPVQAQTNPDLFRFNPEQKGKTKVIMIVGVNGAGKTTTIGKLATKWTAQGAKVVVGACDTFRAAAVDQLQVWCERAGAEMIRAKEGANPSGVGFDALQRAINIGADYCLLDTAGRLHTKANLMDELTKSKNVLSKLDPDAPHEVLLVIDAITGQNAVRQAEEFHKALGLTGLIFTKCDGSSKAGSAISIVQELNVPLTYIGVGEGVEDLDVFETKAYLKALLDL